MATVAVTTPMEKNPLSLPLYVSGLTVTLCGVLTVAYTVENAGFTTEALLLTLAGFGFSLGCRALRINSRIIEWLCLGLIAFAVYGALALHMDWSALMPSGTDRNDTKLAVLLCWGAVLRAWVLFSDDAVLSTPLLVFAAIGLVSSFDLNTPVAVYFCVGVVATTFLLIHYHALRQRALASPSERARETPGLLPAQLGLAVLCGLAVIGLGCVLIVPLEAVSRNLSLAGAIRQLANLGTPNGAGTNVFRFTDDSSLLVGTGEGWSASPQVLMRVTPDDGQPHLWRGRTYDQYVGAGWASTQEDQAARVGPPIFSGDGGETFTVPTAAHPERPLLTTACDVVGDTDEFYYAAEPRRLTLAKDYGDSPRAFLDGRLDLSGHSLYGAHYTAMSLLAPDPMDPAVQERLRRAGTDYPAAVRALYLGDQDRSFYRDSAGREAGGLAPPVAAFLRASVAQALRGLPAKRRTPIDEALAIRAWVANRCVYSLAAPAIPRHTDRVYEFLAHTRLGYCDLFASSMTMLCRSAGLPARLATGFAPGEQDGQTYNLRALDKHAWTEVYFPGAGWLAFDPTMGTRTDGSVPTSTPRRHWDWQAFVRRLGAGPVALSVLILALLLYVAKTEGYDRWRARRPAAKSGPRPVQAIQSDIGRRYARMLRLMRGMGLPRDPAETPGEYAARARAFLLRQSSDAPNPATVEALTAQFIAARYGGAESPSAAQAQSADQALRVFAAAARRLRWARLWDTVRGRGGAQHTAPLR